MCVLGAINERYEELCDVRMYVSLCLKLRILNLEGHQNCLIGPKVTAILPPFKKKKKKKTSNIGMWGCLSRGNRLEYCAAHSDFIFGECI